MIWLILTLIVIAFIIACCICYAGDKIAEAITGNTAAIREQTKIFEDDDDLDDGDEWKRLLK